MFGILQYLYYSSHFMSLISNSGYYKIIVNPHFKENETQKGFNECFYESLQNTYTLIVP